MRTDPSSCAAREGGVFDTIAAIATGQVLSAIGIVRLSGPHALPILDRVFTPLHGEPMSRRESRKLVLGRLTAANGALLDICMATVSRGPGSYTGEDTAELQCHGSPVVLQAALESLFAAGARQALAGEFSRRAFLNGRMDLTQTEAVVDLIDAQSPQAAEIAAGQLQGAIRQKTGAIYRQLTNICSHYHAVIDYPDEEIEPFTLEQYRAGLAAAAETLSRLLATFRRGNTVKNGLPCVILGRPNAGKSSLLNAILGYNRAIVTSIPGTTRDTIEEKAVLGGKLLRLLDTAGLRSTEDPIEREGVERAEDAASQAELILAVLDGSQPLSGEDDLVLKTAAKAPRHLVIQSKADLPAVWFREDAIPLSALTGAGLDRLEEAVSALFPEDASFQTGEVLTNARQSDAVGRALDYVRAALEALDTGYAPDAVLTEIEGALSALGELSGRVFREDITNGIFARFCVGK